MPASNHRTWPPSASTSANSAALCQFGWYEQSRTSLRPHPYLWGPVAGCRDPFRMRLAVRQMSISDITGTGCTFYIPRQTGRHRPDGALPRQRRVPHGDRPGAAGRQRRDDLVTNLAALLFAVASRLPDRSAVSDDRSSRTYRELAERVARRPQNSPCRPKRSSAASMRSPAGSSAETPIVKSEPVVPATLGTTAVARLSLGACRC